MSSHYTAPFSAPRTSQCSLPFVIFVVFFQFQHTTPPPKAYHSECLLRKGLGLNLMIPLDSLLVTWWYALVTSRGAPLFWHGRRCSCRCSCRCRGTIHPMICSPIPFRCGLRPSPSLLLLLRWMVYFLLPPPIDIIISNPATLATVVVVGNFLVVRLRIGGDYVPGMNESREITKNA